MRIKQISVNGLFGIFDHVIPLNRDERITVIHGPNGFGKTAILRILNGLFNSEYSDLKKIPFKKFKVELDNDEIIEIVRNSNDSEKEEKIDITFNLNKPGSEPFSFPLKQLTFFIIGLQDKIFDGEPKWLKELKNSIHIRLIESQRLLNFVHNSSSRKYQKTHSIQSTVSLYSDEVDEVFVVNNPSRRYLETPSMQSTVSAYSEELSELMQDKFKEYGTTSQSLDRTFPLRVVKQQPSTNVNVTNEELRQQLNKLESTRSRLIEVGLIDKEENSEFQIQPQDIDESDESTKNALSVYVKDVEKKLNVFA